MGTAMGKSGHFLETETLHVVMLGLDSAGKTTVLYRLKFDQYLNTVPTIGFNCEKIQGTYGKAKGIQFLVWDVGGQEKLRPLWRSYTRCTDGILFVVDSVDMERMEEAKMELMRTAKCPENQGVPVLVLANKQDLPGARDPKELEAILGLHEIVAPAMHICTSSNITISSSSSTGNISGCGSNNSVGSGTGSGTSQKNTTYCTGCPLPTNSKIQYGKCCTAITPDNVCSQLHGDVLRKTHNVRKEDELSKTNIGSSSNTAIRDQSPLPTTKSDSLSSMLDRANFCSRRNTQQKACPVTAVTTATAVSSVRISTSMNPTVIVGAHSSPSSLASTPTATMANTNFGTTTITTTPPPSSSSNAWFSGKKETSDTGQQQQQQQQQQHHHHHQHHHHSKSKSTASSNASSHHLCWPSYKSWHIQPACAITGEGLQEGLEALYDMIQRRRKWHKAHKKKR